MPNLNRAYITKHLHSKSLSSLIEQVHQFFALIDDTQAKILSAPLTSEEQKAGIEFLVLIEAQSYDLITTNDFKLSQLDELTQYALDAHP